MTLPDHITRRQITDAFAALGLDASEVISWSGNIYEGWLSVRLMPKGAHGNVEYLVARIPIERGQVEMVLEQLEQAALFTTEGTPA